MRPATRCFPLVPASVAAVVALAVLAATVAVAPPAPADPAPPVAWAQRAGGAGDDNASAVTTDGGGNLFVTGKFGGTSTWGSGVAAVTLHAAGGSRDTYVARYAPDGTLAWVVKAGGTGYDEGRDVAVDASGHVYVAGSFTRTATFGTAGAAVTLTSSPAEVADVFLARYDAATGALQWVVKAGGTGSDVAYGVALDTAGNPYITGQFAATATFGSGAAARTITSVGGTDVFVARYGPAGGLAWVVKAGGTGNEYGAAIAVDTTGGVHVVGPFTGSGFWGWGVKLTSAGGTDAFVGTWGSNGSLLRARAQGGTGPDNALGVAVGSDGTEYVSGSYSGTATFGTGLGTTNRTAAGGTDAFLARYSPSGDLAWVASAGGSGGDLASVVTLDNAGAPVVTGSFVGPSGFGSGVAATTLTGAGGTDVFVARYDSTGALTWVSGAGGSGGDVGLGVAVAPDGAVTAVGLYIAAMTFPGGTTLDPMGIRDIYIARLGA